MNFAIKYSRPINIFLIILFIATLSASIYRDYKNQQKGYPCDLRKRIVGARYMAKGYSPYYFKWTPAYPVELCIQYEVDSTFKQNIVTLPPGYTWLLQPLASLQFPTIEKLWTTFQYFSILFIFSIFYFKTKNKTTRSLLLIAYSFLFFSKAWIMDIEIGQSYIVFPLLLTIPYAFFNKQSNALFYYGIFIGICIWLRPSCIFLALPFILAEKRLLFFKGIFFTGGICLIQIIVFQQYENWIDFFSSSANWLDYYSQKNSDNGEHFDRLVYPAIIETQTNFNNHPLPGYIANVPIVLKSLFGIYASSAIYGGIYLAIIVILMYLFYKHNVKDPTLLLLLGFCFNYLSQVFIWIPKCDYYYVELFFPICVLIFNQHKVDRTILLLLYVALFFSAYFYKLIPMQLLVGEYLTAGAIFLYLFASIKRKSLEKKHVE